MPTELELAGARKKMDAAREEMDAHNQSIQDAQVEKVRAFRAAEKVYKELSRQVEEV